MSARLRKRLFLHWTFLPAGLSGAALPAGARVLTSEAFFLPSGPGNPASAPYQDMIVNTAPLTTWGEKGAVGLKGPLAIFPSGGGFVNTPASTVAFKFNIGVAVDSLNAAYGTGKWSISDPKLTFQYTYYANNPIFGGGAGSFETYWVANDNWAFGNGGPSGNAYSDSKYVPGTDPVYATSAAAILSWAGGEADLGSTAYDWPSPSANPNYTSWSTAKTGPNQGLLTADLTPDPLLVNDVTSAAAASDPNVSFYLVPNTSTLGLTIFTGGGNVTPELSFDAVTVPEPALKYSAVIAVVFPLLRRRH